MLLSGKKGKLVFFSETRNGTFRNKVSYEISREQGDETLSNEVEHMTKMANMLI